MKTFVKIVVSSIFETIVEVGIAVGFLFCLGKVQKVIETKRAAKKLNEETEALTLVDD